MPCTRPTLGLVFPFVTILACSHRHDPPSDADAAADNADVVYCVGEPGPPCFCLPKDGAPACRVDGAAGRPCTCGAAAEGAPNDEAEDAPGPNAPPDATAVESGPDAFVGAWTLTGTQSFVCSTESAQADPIAATVTFSRGPGATDAGEVDLLFDAGVGCSLAMFVSGGVARLVSAPQTCAPGGQPIDRDFTSVEVKPSGASLDLTETFTDPTGCQYEVHGILTR